MIEIRKAVIADIPSVMKVISEARETMRTEGNATQWAGPYPSEGTILADVDAGYGHICLYEGGIVGYFALIPGPEPTYSKIFDGEWLDKILPYYVIHRIASVPEVHGVFKAIIDFCSSGDAGTDEFGMINLRIDTHKDNAIMRKLLDREGFIYCGIIHLASGDERLAYQRLALPLRSAEQDAD